MNADALYSCLHLRLLHRGHGETVQETKSVEESHRGALEIDCVDERLGRCRRSRYGVEGSVRGRCQHVEVVCVPLHYQVDTIDHVQFRIGPQVGSLFCSTRVSMTVLGIERNESDIYLLSRSRSISRLLIVELCALKSPDVDVNQADASRESSCPGARETSADLPSAKKLKERKPGAAGDVLAGPSPACHVCPAGGTSPRHICDGSKVDVSGCDDVNPRSPTCDLVRREGLLEPLHSSLRIP